MPSRDAMTTAAISPRTARTGITADPGINSQPAMTLKARDQPGGIQRAAIERCPHLAEPFCAQLAPVRELVASIPAPRCDHRQHEDPAFAQQALVDIRIALADFFGQMGEVELDRAATARLEVYEQQPALRGEHVARVRLAVQ